MKARRLRNAGRSMLHVPIFLPPYSPLYYHIHYACGLGEIILSNQRVILLGNAWQVSVHYPVGFPLLFPGVRGQPSWLAPGPREQIPRTNPRLSRIGMRKTRKNGLFSFGLSIQPNGCSPCRSVDWSRVVNQQRVSFWHTQW